MIISSFKDNPDDNDDNDKILAIKNWIELKDNDLEQSFEINHGTERFRHFMTSSFAQLRYNLIILINNFQFEKIDINKEGSSLSESERQAILNLVTATSFIAQCCLAEFQMNIKAVKKVYKKITLPNPEEIIQTAFLVSFRDLIPTLIKTCSANNWNFEKVDSESIFGLIRFLMNRVAETHPLYSETYHANGYIEIAEYQKVKEENDKLKVEIEIAKKKIKELVAQ